MITCSDPEEVTATLPFANLKEELVELPRRPESNMTPNTSIDAAVTPPGCESYGDREPRVRCATRG
jgi:hypothetical protein